MNILNPERCAQEVDVATRKARIKYYSGAIF
jgi:hypothetical protein